MMEIKISFTWSLYRISMYTFSIFVNRMFNPIIVNAKCFTKTKHSTMCTCNEPEVLEVFCITILALRFYCNFNVMIRKESSQQSQR